ncbi:alkaline phosphatase family protein [Echinimonas agarilytica]|uniref:Alkaline phosphatase family protein n=1 Tax=Echinimonas agarilytica TaxID=1215918 RepID=A0AA42B9A7_9GAMM|nr:alkaline phosphatase family protein [Echinimonas agarilytica]MCM2681323.1 alkaline phosphatase family protein [Echinimonas agarilytica]
MYRFIQCTLGHLLLISAICTSPYTFAADNLVVISLDGVRWQETFRGADPQLIKHKEYVRDSEKLVAAFSRETMEESRQVLMPFISHTIEANGALIGNRDNHGDMQVSNTWWFSYPGYNEILTGKADPKINSNKLGPNPNITFLEWLNGQHEFAGKVAAFGSWDAFDNIVNEQRAGIVVNSGFDHGTHQPQDEQLQQLNAMIDELPKHWHNVRFDALTYGIAKHYITHQKPRVVYIALGETDDFAHDGRYDQYLHAAQRSDAFIQDLWQTLQSTEQYRNNTNLVITVDHGRGSNPDDWKHHASPKATSGYLDYLKEFKDGIVGSNHIWLAAIGPDIKARGQLKNDKPLYQNQIAATALMLLGQDYKQFNAEAGQPLMMLVE